MDNIYWADLHNHNEVGYGKGSLERSYRIASNVLDAYAFTPHGWWPDPPHDDPRVHDYHMTALDKVRDAYPTVIEKANNSYQPGGFVPFVAYEWHSAQWGDYVVLFPGSEGELFRAANLEELQEFARSRGALLIPHHVAYRQGWRGLDWNGWQQDVSPLCEVFSEHGNTFESPTHWPMLAHSMGGSQSSQTVLRQIQAGRVLGFTAGTDNHYGYPANYCEGLTGIVADELTREAIFAALKARHTFATSGERLEMKFRCGDAIMGNIHPTQHIRNFQIEVWPQAPLSFVEIYKNGYPIQHWPVPPAEYSGDAGTYLIRLEWGWGMMDNPEVTQWQIGLSLKGGTLAKIHPCFCGGAASDELVNEFEIVSPTEARIRSFTSRSNALPTNGVVLEVEGLPSTQLMIEVESQTGNACGASTLTADVAALARDEVWGSVQSKFSAPKIRLGSACWKQALSFHESWSDTTTTGPNDSYLVKAQQANGHLAYCSPIWFKDGE